jgi:CheY-like chemotaxis protein
MSPQAALRPILLIEDNPMDIDLTLRAFAKRQLANPIEVVEDGEAAMARIDQWEQGLAEMPSLILLDLKLPKVDGLDVLRRLKSSLKLRVIAVVVLTTSAEDRDVQLAYELGANSYIVKPVSFDKFLQVAEQIELYWGLLNQPYT